jgi:hypothetical protein
MTTMLFVTGKSSVAWIMRLLMTTCLWTVTLRPAVLYAEGATREAYGNNERGRGR